jgi:glutamine synthetase
MVAYEDLDKLLADDNKVKLAGERISLCRGVDPTHTLFSLPGIDVDGVLRGKYVSKKKFLSAAKPGSSFGFASVIL